MKELLKRLEKAEPDSYREVTNLIERHIQNIEKLNMLLDAIPKFIAQRTGEDESEAGEIIPDILSCDTPDEVCEELNKWMVKNGNGEWKMKKIVLIPVKKEFGKETDRLHKIFKCSGAFVTSDCGEDSVSSRIRTAEKQKDTGAILVIGESEIKSQLFSPRFVCNPLLTISELVEIMKRS